MGGSGRPPSPPRSGRPGATVAPLDNAIGLRALTPQPSTQPAPPPAGSSPAARSDAGAPGASSPGTL